MSPLRWTCKSTRQLAATLQQRGHRISHQLVAELLRSIGYSLQGNAKTLEGSQHPDRDAQFNYLSEQSKTFQAQGSSVVSMDAQKKELVGQFKNQGLEWQPQKQPVTVNVHDFPVHGVGSRFPMGSMILVKTLDGFGLGKTMILQGMPLLACIAGGNWWAGQLIHRQSNY